MIESAEQSINLDDLIKLYLEKDRPDQILFFYGLLEIAAIVRYVPDDLPEPFKVDAITTLEIIAGESREWSRSKLLPQLLLSRLRGVGVNGVSSENNQAALHRLYFEFLGIVNRIKADPSIEAFRYFLAESTKDASNSLLEVLENPQKCSNHIMEAPEEQHVENSLLCGFQRFLDFCVEFDSLLLDCAEYEILQSALFYCFYEWFNENDKSANWKMNAYIRAIKGWPNGEEQSRSQGNGFREHVRRLESALQRLSSGKYTRKLDEIVAHLSIKESRFLLHHADLEGPPIPLFKELFERQSELTPNATALVYRAEQLTYAALNARANQAAHYLRKVGIGPGSIVAICMERSSAMVIALLGVLKAGAAYLPLDPGYPQDRLGYVIKDAQASILLTHQGMQSRFQIFETVPIAIDEHWHIFEQESSSNLPAFPHPEDLAYVIYTSGSTGRPKGVAIEHSALANLLSWHVKQYTLSADDRVTQTASPGFDAAVWEILPPLTTGASLYIVDDDVRLVPPEIPNYLLQNKITIAFLPTPLAEAALREEWPDNMNLRFLLTGGDRLHHISNYDHSFALINHYGPTECTVVTCAGVVDFRTGNAPYIGKAIAGMSIYILDDQMEMVPQGVPGELYIGGPGLARGYIGHPELTAEKFLPNPFSSVPGARLYRTGDSVQLAHGANLDFIGRIDQQVKLRGFRIELSEIEAALLQNSAVEQAVVVATEDAKGEGRLVAYTVPSASTKVDATELRKHLQKHLPEYMVPSAFVFLDRLPLTANGKLDRKNLPQPGLDEELRHTQLVGPRSPIEQVLKSIWEEVLRVNEIGVFDNFFELGGHSLLAIQVASMIQKVGLNIKLTDLFAVPTISGLATRIALSYGNQTDHDSDDILELQTNFASIRELRERGREMAIRANRRELEIEDITNLMQVADSISFKFRQSAMQSLVKGYREGIAENKQSQARHVVDKVEGSETPKFNKEQ